MKKIIAGIGFELTGTLMLLCTSLSASMNVEIQQSGIRNGGDIGKQYLIWVYSLC